MGLKRFKKKWIRKRVAGFPDKAGSIFFARREVERKFHECHGYPPNLKSPASFNEKIQWRKLYDHNPLYPILSDKWRVREYVRQRVGDGVLNEIYYRGTNPEEIPFADLPDKFVVKAIHGSGWTLPVRDKNEMDFGYIRALCHEWLSQRYGREDYEWAYYGIPAEILIEEFVDDPATSHPIPPDYKLYVFDGRVRLIHIDLGRYYSAHSKAIFDPDWRYLDFEYNYPQAGPVAPPPALEEMKSVAEHLARSLDFARVDLYQADDGVRFGEITLYPNSGYGVFKPREWDYELGNWWQLPR